MMVLNSIHKLLFLLILWQTCFGPQVDANNLLSLGLSTFPNVKNDSRQNFNINFQMEKAPTDDNFDDDFENREVKFTILDQNKRKLEEKSIVFDGRLTGTMNSSGKFIGLTEWIKHGDGMKVQVSGYFSRNAHEKHLLVEEIKKNKSNHRLAYRKITFDERVKLKMFMKTVAGDKVDKVNVGSLVTIFCKVLSKTNAKPKFEGLKLQYQAVETDEMTKEIRLTFRAEKETHLKTISCVAGKTRRALTIKVLYAPAAVKMTPAEIDALMAGDHLKCFATDGYPQPIVTWLPTSVPPNGDKFYRTNQTTNASSTFTLKENAPVGSVWTMTCRASNVIGNVTLSVNFTVKANQIRLLSDRLSKIEETLKQLQGANQTSLLSKQLSRLEERLKTMETGYQQKTFDERLHYLETKMKRIYGEEKLVVAGNYVDYNEAVKLCKAKGMNLLKILNKEQNDMAFEFAEAKYITYFWIDGNRRENKAKWVDSNGLRITYTNWSPGEPNNHAGIEKCINSWKHHSGRNTWNDVPCSNKYTAICYRPTAGRNGRPILYQQNSLVQRLANVETKMKKIVGERGIR